MALFGRRTARQREIRRSRAERQPAWYRRLTDAVPLRRGGVLLLCALVAALIVNLGGERLRLQVGQRVSRAMTARVRFRVADEMRTRDIKMRARDNAENYYTLDLSLLQDINNRLTKALRIAREQASEPEKLREQARDLQVLLDDAGLPALVQLATQDSATLYEQAVERAVRNLRRQPLVEAAELALRRTGQQAILIDPGQGTEQGTERSVSILRLQFANDAEAVQQVAAATAAEFPAALRESMTRSLERMLRTEQPGQFRPLYRYDTARSAQAAKEAEERVEMQYDEFPRGAILADAGALAREELELLRREHQHYLATLAAPLPPLPPEASADALGRHHEELAWWQAERQRVAWGRIGRGIIALLLVAGLGGYVVMNYHGALGGARRRIATVVTLLFVLLLARWAYLYTPTAYLAVGAYALAVAILTTTASRPVANILSAALALLVALATHQGVGFAVVLISVSLVLLYGLRQIRTRGRIISFGALAAVVAAAGSLFNGLVEGQALGYVLKMYALWAGVTTLAAAFVVEGILPSIERLFGVTTAMTLLEWCDPSKPLLRMLAAEAPGTYNHSLMVGTLADAAAQAIGADGLLARTGAYYHDIGKINKPGYFVENQAMDVGNRHERLSPAMSHLIIIGHVKDGIEMAREYSVPSRLHPFIPEHHGTCVVEYFYHAATQARKPGDPEVSESEFRYPGPKPRSRETAIVMMCDAVEGAVRAMPEPTPGRIEDTVERMIQKRLMDGQFDECDLTFRELEAIRASLVKSLNSIYHGRIRYPSAEKSEEKRSAS